MVYEPLYHDLQKWRAYAWFFGPFCSNCSLVFYILGAFLIKQLFHSRLLDMRWLYSQLGATRLVGYLSSHIQRAYGIIVKYKLIAILRRQYHIILTASWEKIYSVLGGVAKRRSPIRNIFSPNAVNIMWYCRLKIAISFVSRSIIYKDKWNCKLINPRLIEVWILCTCETSFARK